MKNKIKDIILQNAELLMKANQIDKRNGGQTLEINNLCNIVELVFDNQNLYGLKLKEINLDNNFVIEKRLASVGSIGIIEENNNISNIFYLIMMSIFNKNSVYINFETSKNLGTFKILVELLKKVVQEKIEITQFETNEFANKVSLLDKLFIVGEKSFFNEVMIDCSVPCCFVPFGKINVVNFSNNFNEQIKKIESCNFYTHEDVNNIKEAVDLISCSSTNYLTVLFTDNAKEAEYFLNFSKSDFSFVNTLPELNNLINLKTADFLRETTLCYCKK
ncbi:MAG: hypothetical protein WCR30_03500 [Clostridia bacterium]